VAIKKICNGKKKSILTQVPPVEKIAFRGSVRIDKSELLPDLSIRQEHYVAT